MIDVERSSDAPASLATNKSYREEDVLEALYRDFLGKCYLCETKLNHHGTMEVDHRIPVTVDETKKFDWTNLYPLYRPFYCNQRRVKKNVPAGGWLNPGEGVETRVLQIVLDEPSAHLPPYVTIQFDAANADDLCAKNTAAELARIHNGTGSDMDSLAPVRAKALRSAIAQHYEIIRDKLAQLDRVTTTNPVEAEQLRADLRKMFARDAPYFMLMKSYFRQIPSASEFLPASA